MNMYCEVFWGIGQEEFENGQNLLTAWLYLFRMLQYELQTWAFLPTTPVGLIRVESMLGVEELVPKNTTVSHFEEEELPTISPFPLSDGVDRKANDPYYINMFMKNSLEMIFLIQMKMWIYIYVPLTCEK